jgi:hypothetical protein
MNSGFSCCSEERLRFAEPWWLILQKHYQKLMLDGVKRFISVCQQEHPADCLEIYLWRSALAYTMRSGSLSVSPTLLQHMSGCLG